MQQVIVATHEEVDVSTDCTVQVLSVVLITAGGRVPFRYNNLSRSAEFVKDVEVLDHRHAMSGKQSDH